MNSKVSLRVASLSLLGSLAAAGCSSEESPSPASSSMTPSAAAETPEGSDDSAATMGTPENSDGVITSAGLLRPAATTENSGAACEVAAGTMSRP